MKESSWPTAKALIKQIGFEFYDDPFERSPSVLIPRLQYPKFDKENPSFNLGIIKGLKLFGLNRDYSNEWILILIRHIFYGFTDFFSFTISSEGVSVVASEELFEIIPSNMIYASLVESKLGVVQLDLADSGLDHYGVIYSLTNPLVCANINLMYLSTFKTANILVAETDLQVTTELI